MRHAKRDNPGMVQTQERPAPPAETPTPTATRSRVWIAIGLITVLAAATLLLRLGVQERSGPPHTSYISLPNGAPATLYVPGHLFHGEFPLPPAPGRRPPLVVVAHGYSADRQTMSSIARSLAKAGYAALALDFRGHGANTRPFRGELDGDLRSALDWADRSPYVDRTRIALFGHSMGASAVLEFASRDPRTKAVIPLSGGDVVDDAHVPPNVLLMAAARDPKVIRDQQAVVARELRGRTNVRTVIVPGKDHLTELWSGTMMRQSISWLDRSLGVARTGPVPGMADP